jgi:hypothetical protein
MEWSATYSCGYGRNLVVDIGEPSSALPAANVYDGSFGHIVKEQVHGPGCTDGVGHNAIKFKIFHPDGGAEGGVLEDLGNVLGGHHFGGGILAKHGKGVVWEGTTGGYVSAYGGLDRAKSARNCFVGKHLWEYPLLANDGYD